MTNRDAHETARQWARDAAVAYVFSDEGEAHAADNPEAACETAADAAIDAFLAAGGALAPVGEPAIVCPDCDGCGHLGQAQDGRLFACELCGGHEDRLGTGSLAAGGEGLRAALRECVAVLEDAAAAGCACDTSVLDLPVVAAFRAGHAAPILAAGGEGLQARFEAVLKEIDDLTNESGGVTGLHLNGEDASWDWLFDEWLANTWKELSARAATPGEGQAGD